MVKRGTFREDLFYRLSVIQVEVPPLRERLDDVPLLADHFLARFDAQAGRRIAGFAPDALAAMTHYAWPGNVRELRNAVERAIVLGDREQIQADRSAAASARAPRRPRALGPRRRRRRSARSMTRQPVRAVARDGHARRDRRAAATRARARSLRELEKEGILAALAATNGNKAQAAAILEIDRSTLYKKLKDYDIEG